MEPIQFDPPLVGGLAGEAEEGRVDVLVIAYLPPAGEVLVVMADGPSKGAMRRVPDYAVAIDVDHLIERVRIAREAEQWDPAWALTQPAVARDTRWPGPVTSAGISGSPHPNLGSAAFQQGYHDAVSGKDPDPRQDARVGSDYGKGWAAGQRGERGIAPGDR